MPLYEYHCNQCNKKFEELVFSDIAKSPSCPTCSSSDTHKLISASGLVGGSLKEPSCASTCQSPESCHSGGTCPMQ